MQHNMIRAQKLEFAWGLASRMVEVINLSQPAALQMLGEIAAYTELARAGIRTAEEGARDYGNGLFLPDERPLFALRALEICTEGPLTEYDEWGRAWQRRPLSMTIHRRRPVRP